MLASLRSRALAGCLAVAMSAVAGAAESLPGASVESLLEFARSRNPEYAAMRLDADAAAQRVMPAGALPDPKLRVELEEITMGGAQSPSLSPNQVGSTKYTLMQDLPWFGKRELKREIAALEADGAQVRATATWLELSARIKSGYAQAYYLSETTRLTTEVMDLMSRLEKIAQARYSGGLAAQQDVIRAQTEQTNLRNELIALENERAINRSQLNLLLARNPDEPLAEPERLRPLPAPAALALGALDERARARSPQLQAEAARVRAADKNLDLTYKNRFPDVTVGIAPVQSRSSIKDWEVMVELNIPLQQATRRSQEREAVAMQSAARARRDSTANQLTAELAQNVSGLEAARRTAGVIRDSLLPQAELTFQAALASYETGKVDFATLLDAQRQIRLAKQNLIKAQAEAHARLADIERIAGEEL